MCSSLWFTELFRTQCLMKTFHETTRYGFSYPFCKIRVSGTGKLSDVRIVRECPCPLLDMCVLQLSGAVCFTTKTETEQECRSPTETTSLFLTSKIVHKSRRASALTVRAVSWDVLFTEKAVCIYIRPHMHIFTCTHVTEKSAASAFTSGLWSRFLKTLSCAQISLAHF